VSRRLRPSCFRKKNCYFRTTADLRYLIALCPQTPMGRPKRAEFKLHLLYWTVLSEKPLQPWRLGVPTPDSIRWEPIPLPLSEFFVTRPDVVLRVLFSRVGFFFLFPMYFDDIPNGVRWLSLLDSFCHCLVASRLSFARGSSLFGCLRKI